MPLEDSPAFQFYVKEWRSSRPVMRMTFAQRGMYLEMLLEQWENLSLPDSPDDCAELIGGSIAEWRKHWPALRRNFLADETTGRIKNRRLEKERAKQRGRNKRASDRGKAGAAARWKTGQKHTDADASGIAQVSPVHATASGADGFPIPIPFPTPDSTPPAEVTSEPLRSARTTVQDVVDLWNQLVTPPIPSVTKIPADRRRKIDARLKEYQDLEVWRTAITWVNGQAWCRAPGTGKHPNWTATIDWLCKNDSTIASCIERAKAESEQAQPSGSEADPLAHKAKASYGSYRW